jgi:hypothetical protein
LYALDLLQKPDSGFNQNFGGLEAAERSPEVILRASYAPKIAHFQQNRGETVSGTFAIGLLNEAKIALTIDSIVNAEKIFDILLIKA